MSEHPSLVSTSEPKAPSKPVSVTAILNESLWVCTRTYHQALQEIRRQAEGDKTDEGKLVKEAYEKTEALFQQILIVLEDVRTKMNPNSDLQRETYLKVQQALQSF